MVSFLFVAVFCGLLAFFLPYALHSLHPIAVLFLWIVVAAMEQLGYAILIVNLNLITQSGNLWDFGARKLIELAGVPLLTIGGVSAAFSRRLPVTVRLAAWFVTPLFVWLLYSFLIQQRGLILLHWPPEYRAIKKFGLMIVYTLAAWGCQTLLRKKGVLG